MKAEGDSISVIIRLVPSDDNHRAWITLWNRLLFNTDDRQDDTRDTPNDQNETMGSDAGAHK
jgi:hypothetical protein